MTSLWWFITVLMMLIGLIGTVIPLLPGTTIILAAAILHHFMLGSSQSVGWWSLGVMIALTLLSYALELLSSSLGAKWFGATRWGAMGGVLGTIVGLFFGLPGLFIGPLAGVLVGELLGGRGLLPAGKSTWGSVLGTTAGMIGNFCIGLLMIGCFLFAALVRL
ncbi:MAG: hypothetical protein JWL90_1165 [Chthoniobacteraceae bacterium]|nr:hypothetical protein [Chthoniobacteraceae bacterium]